MALGLRQLNPIHEKRPQSFFFFWVSRKGWMVKTIPYGITIPRKMNINVRWISRIFNRILYLPDCYLMRLTTLLNYHLIDWLIDDATFVCLLDDLILAFCYSNLTRETGGFELESTIALVLQAKQLNKCASHSLGFLMISP